MKINPCYECTQETGRTPGCHSRCIKYKEWKKYQSKANKARHKDDDYGEYVTNLIQNNRRINR